MPPAPRQLPRFLPLVAALALVGSASADTYEQARGKLAQPGWLSLKAAELDVLRTQPEVPAGLGAATLPPADRAYLLVKVTGPVTEMKKALLRATGVELLDFLQVNTFVVRGSRSAGAAATGLPFVAWSGPLHPFYKLDPTIGARAWSDGRHDSLYLDATIWRGEPVDDAVRALAAAGAQVLQVWDEPPVRRVRLRAAPEHLAALVRVTAVEFVAEVGQVTRRNDATTWVCQSNVAVERPIWDHGIHGEGQVVGHLDGRLDRNHCDFVDLTNNTPGPTHRKLVAYHSSSGYGADGHGTHTAGTIAGDQFPVTGATIQNGHAYGARISHSNLDDITGYNNTASNLAAYLTLQHSDGARLHTNSWGEDYTTQYTSFCVDIDTFSRQYEDSLVVFAETNVTGPVFTPENAKNVLAVGLTRPPPNQDTKAWGGSAPTADGRRKPEIYAPGSSTLSAQASSSCSSVALGGTSMACPAIAGNGALVRQYYTEGWYPSGAPVAADAFTPTGALIKATLLNGTTDMTSIPGFPTNQEGWGRLRLDDSLSFAGEPRKLLAWDVRNATGLGTGGLTERELSVDASSEALRITLVFTDQPASLLAASTPINDLDLEVETPAGTVFLGNVFDTAQGESMAGGSPDPLNNVEQVLVKTPSLGTWKVRVRAPNAPMGPQGYALVVTGAVSPPATPPMADFTAAPLTGPAPLAVTFTDLSAGSPISFSWDFGDGGTSPAQNPTHVYTSPGSYTVALTVANVFGSDTLTRPSYIDVTTASPATEEIVTGAGPAAANAPVVTAWDHASPPAASASFAAYGAPDWGANVAIGAIDAGATPAIVTGPGPGGSYGPHVRAFQPDGTPLAKVAFYAYGTLRYGAHGAMAGLDSDAHAEIVTTPGPGAVFGPHVRGWNYDGGALAAIAKINFFAYGTLRFGARAAGGDVDADGYGEILTGAGAGAVFVPHVRTFDFDAAAIVPGASFFAFAAGSYGAAVAAGDGDGDGRDEAIAAHGPDAPQDGETRAFAIGAGATAVWSVPTLPGSLGGAEPAAGDLDADAVDELVVGAGWGTAAPSRVEVWEITGSAGTLSLSFDAYPGQSFGTKVAAGDTGTP